VSLLRFPWAIIKIKLGLSHLALGGALQGHRPLCMISDRGFSTDERRANAFRAIDEARTALDEVRIRFPRMADQIDVTSRP
jgi:hypothetical protein